MSPVLLISVTMILLAMCQQSRWPRLPLPSAKLAGLASAAILPTTLRVVSRHAASGKPFDLYSTLHAAARISNPGGPQSSRDSRGRGRDPLRAHRALVGLDTRTPWYIRVRALIMLVLIVIGMGMAIAGVTLLILASGRFLLEILAG